MGLLRKHRRDVESLTKQLDKRSKKWRLAVESGDLSGLDPATIALILKLLLLFIKIAPFIFAEDE